MKKIILCFFISISGIFQMNAQIAHDLEIYSENGEKFILTINGRQMNEEPASNIQITNTNNDFVNVKIVFEGDSILPIEKKFLQIATPGNVEKLPVSTVYKIINKKGNYKLNFVSRSEKKIQPQNIIINEAPTLPKGRVVISW